MPIQRARARAAIGPDRSGRFFSDGGRARLRTRQDHRFSSERNYPGAVFFLTRWAFAPDDKSRLCDGVVSSCFSAARPPAGRSGPHACLIRTKVVRRSLDSFTNRFIIEAATEMG